MTNLTHARMARKLIVFAHDVRFKDAPEVYKRNAIQLAHSLLANPNEEYRGSTLVRDLTAGDEKL